MDEIRIRELPQKNSAISLSDLLIIEDEDGTKTMEASAFKSLIQQSIFYNTVEDMKNATLREGDIIKTLGYRTVNDGGGAYYQIVYAPTDVEDGIYIHYLHTSDTLRAHYVMGESDINISQAGAYGDGVNDDYSVIQRMLNTGNMVTVPRRTYKVSGSLDVHSNTIIDLNGSTIVCASSAVFSIGVTHEAKNIVIKNGNIVGLNGIDIYSKASNITISDCNIYGAGSNAMSKGITIFGADRINIYGCRIGLINECRYGIYISNGSEEGSDITSINENISISNVFIVSSMAGISFSGTFADRNINISDYIIEGYGDKTGKSMYGILVSSDVDSLSVSNGSFQNLNCAIMVSGIISAVASFNNVLVNNSDIMYNLASSMSTIYLDGIQQFSGNDAGTAYIFDRITSKVVFQGEFEADRSIKNIRGLYKTSLEGEVVDIVDPVTKRKISVVSLDNLNNETNTNTIPGYKNIALNLEFSGAITDIKFPSLTGQVIALYSDVTGCKLIPGSKIKIPSEIELSRFEPVLLKNNSGIWSMVQFGGSGSGSSSGGGTTTTTGLEKLTLLTGGNKACEYDGTAPRELDITPNAIGAAERVHRHSANEVSGIPVVPTSLRNPYNLILKINGGSTEGTDMFTYDGSKEMIVNISGGGSGSIDLNKYGTKLDFEGTGTFSVNRKSATKKGANSVAIGLNTESTGECSIAIGLNTTSKGKASFAEGDSTAANGNSAHAEGNGTSAVGDFSHTEGINTSAGGDASHAEGRGTLATGANQHVEGRYNVDDPTGTYAHILGGGSGTSNRKNLYTVDWTGNAKYSGNVSMAEPTKDEHATTKHYVDILNEAATKAASDVSKSLDLLKLALGANMFAGCTVVEDWNDVNQNGFVCGTGALNSPPSATDWIMGIVLANGTEEQEADSVFVMAISMVDDFESYDNTSNDVTLGVYMRKKSTGEWGDWYKMKVGKGTIDEL